MREGGQDEELTGGRVAGVTMVKTPGRDSEKGICCFPLLPRLLLQFDV